MDKEEFTFTVRNADKDEVNETLTSLALIQYSLHRLLGHDYCRGN